MSEWYPDDDFLRDVEGLFVGQLDEAEYRTLNRLVGEGRAHRSYRGVAGFMGLAKIRSAPTDTEDER